VPSSPEVIPPFHLQKALERGLCLYSHLTIQATLPPGVYEFEIKPPNGVYCCRNFALTFGDLDPAGYSSDFIVTHYSGQVVMHEDPWISSVVDYVYPLADTITAKDPHVVIVENKTAVTQTFDITLHWMEFVSVDDWNKYRALVEESARILNVLKQILGILQEFTKFVSEVLRKIAEKIKAPIGFLKQLMR